MAEMSTEDWLATHKSEGPTHVHELDHAVQRAYDDIAEAIKLLAAGSYIPGPGTPPGCSQLAQNRRRGRCLDKRPKVAGEPEALADPRARVAGRAVRVRGGHR
jgi:hypothetical protein